MIEDINCKQLKLRRKEIKSGVYIFRSNDEVIYIGSSKNLYRRMFSHRKFIKRGSNGESQKELYNYLANNKFEIEIIFDDNYKKLEQKLIDELKPKFNQRKAILDINHINHAEYMRQYFATNEEQRRKKNERNAIYYREHKEYFINYRKEKRKAIT